MQRYGEFFGKQEKLSVFSALLGFQAAFVSLVRSIWECKSRADFRECKGWRGNNRWGDAVGEMVGLDVRHLIFGDF